MSDNPFLAAAGITPPPQDNAVPGGTIPSAPTRPDLHNPGNLKPGFNRDGSPRIVYPGQTGVDHRGIATFADDDSGRQAGISQLQTYQRQAGRPLSFFEIARKYAPRGDGANNPDAYAAVTSRAFGKKPNDPIDLSDPSVAAQLFAAHVGVEQGTPVPSGLGDLDNPPLGDSGETGSPNPFLAAAGIGQTGTPAASTTSAQSGQPVPSVSDYLGGSQGQSATPGSQSFDLGNAVRGAGNWLVRNDPISDAIVNGGDNRLARYGANMQDALSGTLHGAAKVPETLLRGGGWLIDNVGAPATSFFGGDTAGVKTAGRWANTLADKLDEWSSYPAHDPNSPIFNSRTLAGEVLATLPAVELKPLEAIPGIRRAIQARDVAVAAGDALPASQRLAAALARYGDMAVGGGVAGGLASGGKDVPQAILGGALAAPVAGAVTEKVLAPIASAVADQASRLRLGQAIKNAVRSGGSDEAAISSDAGAALPPLQPGQVIRSGADLANQSELYRNWQALDPATRGSFENFQRETANGAVFDRLVAKYGDQFKPGFAEEYKAITGEEPALAVSVTGGQPPVPARAAFGSSGARRGMEGTTDLPPAVADHVARLTKEGVPPEQAIREADITFAGGKPTIATVTRDPLHQQAEAEGAKLVQIPEGRALNAQVAENNAAVTRSMQDLVARNGGAPAQGEGAEQVARSLAQASDAEQGKVRALYDAADVEAADAQRAADVDRAGRQAASDNEAAVAAQASARSDLDRAQANYRQLRDSAASTSAQVNKARADMVGARETLRKVTDSPPKGVPVAPDAPGYIDLRPLRAALNEPTLANPTIEGAKTLRSGILGQMDAYGSGGDLYTARQAEALRQSINDAYDPIGGSINGQVGRLKSVLDNALDNTDAGAKYRAARAAHRAWADKYENPEGVARLIQRDAKGNFRNQDNWRAAENGLVGHLSDRQFVQVADRLKANQDAASTKRLKALILQRAYEQASKGALDAGGNAIASGDAFFRELDKIGMPKLTAIFSKGELAEIASIGRAAKALNNRVPGTVNHSNTASAASSDIGRRLVEGIAHARPGNKGAVGVHAGASLLGAGATLLGHTTLGPAAGLAISGGKIALDAVDRRASAKALANALRDASNPAVARAAARGRNEKLVRGLRQQATARKAATVTKAAAVNMGSARLAEALKAQALQAHAAGN